MEPLESLIEALRGELQQYGEMLARLDQEQELVFQRAAGPLLETVASIQEQATVLQEARAVRESCREALAASLGLPLDTALTTMITQLPADYRPLLEALVRENNQLLMRVQQRARQNHLLLSRSVELMQRFLATLFPSRDTQVYDPQGQRSMWMAPLRPLYEAVG